MHWLSQSVEELVEKASKGGRDPEFEVLVVGSGYGGSVAALRFAQAGHSVTLLERGEEYVAGEFPSDLSQIGAFIRAETSRPQGASAMGYESALFDFRVGDRANALVGNGLGGGSLINAAVALQPDAEVFTQSAWPSELQGDDLSQDFDRARAGLEIQGADLQKQSPACVVQNTLKYQRMQDIAQTAKKQFGPKGVEVRFEDVPLAIEFRQQPTQGLGNRNACVGCGDCCSGCNHDAKLSLNKTYLPRARKAGASIFTGVSVLAVSYKPGSDHPAHDWEILCVRTAERGTWEKAHPLGKGDAYTFRLHAKRVVLSAGTFGSTEILLRSRRNGLPVADAWLGKGISANGDDLSAAYDLSQEANAIGQGSSAPVDPTSPQVVGPTISAVVRFKDPKDFRQSTITQDGGVPGLLRTPASEVFTTLGLLPQLARWGLRGKATDDPLAVRPQAIANSLALLGMGHDSASGAAELIAYESRLNWSWNEKSASPAQALHRQRAACVKELGAEFLPNPVSGVLPDGISEVLSGPKQPEAWVTVHPLGGCRMANDFANGVVNHLGQVFKPDGTTYPGLMVLDGSIIPSSLGVNPLLTITALAERACRLVMEQPAGKTAADVKEEELKPCPPAPPLIRTPPHALRGTLMAEVLRGALQVSPDAATTWPWLKTSDDSQILGAALFLEMDVTDWSDLWQDPLHRVEAIAAQNKTSSFTASRLVIDTHDGQRQELPVTSGWVQLFSPKQDWFLGRAERMLRSGITYWISRWRPDLRRPSPNPSKSLFLRLPGLVRGGLKLLWHASAARTFVYELALQSDQGGLVLKGSKFIQPAMSWCDIGSWLQQKMKDGGWPAPQRRSVWDQLTQLDVTLNHPSQAIELASGRLSMDIPEMTRRIAPQLKPGPDSLTAMSAMASYPLILLRHLLISRILDFRLPDYKADLPHVDPLVQPDQGPFELAQSAYPDLQLAGNHRVPAQPPVGLEVRLHPHDENSQEKIWIGLVRYAQPKVHSVLDGQGMRRFKSIILFNGFAQNTLPFVAPELGQRSLAAMLYAQGWDIWLLEYRVSPFLRASAKMSSMDDIGAADIPAAVDHVLKQLQSECPLSEHQPPQLFVFSHCVGSASMAMSLLGGHLTHTADAVGPDKPKVAGVLFSQFQPFVVGSVTAQMRLQVASVLVNAMGLDYVQFAAGTVQADVLHALMDRLFASFHSDEHERCPGESDLRLMRCPGESDLRLIQPDCTSCKRMSGFLSRLFRHDQLIAPTPGQRGTHEKLDEYFGKTNLGVFLHGAKCVDYEKLVDADGQNIYVTDDNIKRFLGMPVMLLHGHDNVLFDKESLLETERQFKRAFGAQRLRTEHDRFFIAPDHAHFDCTIGKNAPEIIFPKVLDFFGNAYTADLPAPVLHPRLRARLPRTGPIAGWARQEAGEFVQRVWIEVDNSQADETVAVMSVVTSGATCTVQAWPLRTCDVQGYVPVRPGVQANQGIMYAVADLVLPSQAQGASTIAMLSLHTLSGNPPELQPEQAHAWPTRWGEPLTLAEVLDSQGRSPLVVDMAATSGGKPTAVPAASSGPAVSSAGAPNASPEQTRAYSVLEDVPAQRLQPLPMELTRQDALALWRPLAHIVRTQRAFALQATPATLSRQRRTLRSMKEAVLRLGVPQSSESLRFVASTCRHPGLSELESWRSDQTLLALAHAVRHTPAHFMWMLGDQIYADARAGFADSASSLERLLPRYRSAFGSAGFRALARRLPMHMVMDDHEINDNWSQDDIALGGSTLSRNALSAFRAFQRAYGPDMAGPEGMDAMFQAAPAAFLSLNTRLHRWRALGPNQARSILHADQWRMLEQWLLAEQGRGRHPKFIVTGSVLAPGLKNASGSPSPRDSDNWQFSPDERLRLLAFIAREHIDNVVFLSGDYHCAARAEITFSHSEVRAYALVSPALHAPLRFANVAAHEVMAHEPLALPGGQAVIEAQAWNGDGWLECEISQSGNKTYQLLSRFRMLRMDATKPNVISHTWQL